MEAPWLGGVLPLADFGTISFSHCTATTDRGQTVAVNSNSRQWQFDQITMEAADGTVKAQPSSSPNGTSFSVVWQHE